MKGGGKWNKARVHTHKVAVEWLKRGRGMNKGREESSPHDQVYHIRHDKEEEEHRVCHHGYEASPYRAPAGQPVRQYVNHAVFHRSRDLRGHTYDPEREATTTCNEVNDRGGYSDRPYYYELEERNCSRPCP